jgi:hypothetical protein
MPWWIRPESVQVPQRHPRPVLVVGLILASFGFLKDLWSVYRHFADIQRLEAVGLIVSTTLLLLSVCGVVWFLWKLKEEGARRPPPPLSNT